MRLARRHPFGTDLALAVAVCLFVVQDVLLSDYLGASSAIYIPAALLMTLPLAWRRRAPLLVLLIVMAAMAAQSIAVGDAHTPDTPLPAWLLAIFTAAMACELPGALVALVASIGAGLVWIGIGNVLFPAVVFGGAWVAGRSVRQSSERARIVEERAEALARARDAEALAVAADERARIARELHDVVGHRVSVMVVQAGAERLALGSERANTEGALKAIENAGRQALGEMRDLVGLLRASGGSMGADRGAPQPSLDDLPELVEQVRAAGIAVELCVEGTPRPLPSGLSLSVYRIVQEALTNVVKHARPARAEVTLGYRPNHLEVLIADDGPGGNPKVTDGHGLVGMRERAALYGGELTTEPGPTSGFVVRALLPLGESSP